jgi:hypothetical protein
MTENLALVRMAAVSLWGSQRRYGSLPGYQSIAEGSLEEDGEEAYASSDSRVVD